MMCREIEHIVIDDTPVVPPNKKTRGFGRNELTMVNPKLVGGSLDLNDPTIGSIGDGAALEGYLCETRQSALYCFPEQDLWNIGVDTLAQTISNDRET